MMIEQDTSDLDLYADLSIEGGDVEGLTDFFRSKKPAVKIAQELSLDSGKFNRLRTTLAHEYGHVRFHTFLWDINSHRRPTVNMGKMISLQRRKYQRFRTRLASKHDIIKFQSLSPAISKTGYIFEFKPEIGPRCKRTRMFDAPFSDWMEWQASYICGAILMPLSIIRNLVLDCMKERELYGWGADDSDHARELTALVAEAFDVSLDAARVRLLKLGFLQKIRGEDGIYSEETLAYLSPC
ncbi:hypothetical protein ACFLWR_03220 [Chloroflexota bacterium]